MPECYKTYSLVDQQSSNTLAGKGNWSDGVQVKIQLAEPDSFENIVDKQDGGHEQRICEQQSRGEE